MADKDNKEQLLELTARLEEFLRDFDNQMSALSASDDNHEFHNLLTDVSGAYAKDSVLIKFIVHIHDKHNTQNSTFKAVISSTVRSLIHNHFEATANLLAHLDNAQKKDKSLVDKATAFIKENKITIIAICTSAAVVVLTASLLIMPETTLAALKYVSQFFKGKAS